MLFALLIQLALSYNLYPTVGELEQYPLNQIFGVMENPTFEILSPSGPFQIVDSIALIGFTQQQIGDIKSLRSNQMQDLYTFLNTQNVLFWSDSTMTSEIPEFTNKYQIPESNCFDSDFIDDYTIIVDCIDSKDYNQFFYVQMQQNSSQNSLAEKTSIPKSTFRKMSVLNGEYIILGLANSTLSLVEAYDLDKLDKSTLDTKTLISLAGIKDKTYKFRLVDFVVRGSLVYVLDQFRVYILQYSKQWRLNTQIILTQQAIAFDVNVISDLNGNEHFELVVLTQGKLLHYQDFINTPEEMTISGTAVQISNQFIIVQNKSEISVINFHDKQIVSKVPLQSSYFLASIFSSSMIVVAPTSIQRFQLSFGYLRCLSQTSTSTLQPLIVKATSGQQTKQFTFQYQVILNTDQTLYEIGQPNLFKTAIRHNFQTETISPFLSGPNIEYKQEGKQEITLQFNQVVGQKSIFPNNSVFHDILMITDTTSLFIFQDKDNVVSLWGCNTYNFMDDCTFLQVDLQLKDKYQLTRNTFQWWKFNEDVYLAFASKNQVDVWSLTAQVVKKVAEISGKYTIKQILSLQNTIYILLDSGEIKVYDNGAIETIILTEKIQQIFGNPYHNSQLLVVKTQSNLIVLRNYQAIQLIQYWPNDAQDIYVAIYDQTFFVVTQTSIEEYSLTPIQLLKKLPLYDYSISTPLTVTQSKHNGLLFVLAKNNILVFKPNQLSHNQLFQVIQTDGAPISLISSDGYHQTELFFHDLVNNHLVVMESPDVMAVLPITQSKDYLTTVATQFTASNNMSSKTYSLDCQIVNDMEKIYISEGQSEVLLGTKNYTQVVSVGNDWYSGQVVRMAAVCNQCSDQITLNQPLTPYIHNLFGDVKVVVNYGNDHFLVVTSDSLIISGPSLNIPSTTYLGQACYQAAVHPQLEYITLACYHDKTSTILVVQCRGSTMFACEIVDQKIQPFAIVTQMTILNENLLLVTSSNAIQVYSINKAQFTLQQTITTTEFQATCNGVNYFTVASVYTDYLPLYLLSILDQEGYIIFLFTQVQNNKLHIITSSVQSLYLLIQDMNMYALSNSRYLQLMQIGQVERDALAHVQIRFLVVCNNTATYAIRFTFDTQNLFSKSDLLFIVNQYGEWTTLNKAYLQYNQLVMVYTNGQKNVLLSYQIPTQYSKQTITSIGGISDFILAQNTPIIAYIFYNADSYRLLSNIVRFDSKISLTAHFMYSSPQLTIANTANLDTRQTITIVLNNDFSTAYRQVGLKELVAPIQQPASIAWIIIVIVLAAVLATVMLIYVLRRRAIKLSYHNYYPMADQQLRSV